MEVAELDPATEVQEKKKGKSYGDETHPYMRPEFWLDPKNQFWNHSSIFRKESYEHILDQCRAELKENLIN